MAHKVWTFQMEDGIHTVEMDHGYYSGKKTIAVDGRVAWQDTGSSNALRNAKGTYPFQFNGHSCAINITTNGISYFYELVVEGQKVEPGQQLNPTVVQSRPPAQNGFGNYGEQAPQNIGEIRSARKVRKQRLVRAMSKSARQLRSTSGRLLCGLP